MDNPPNAVVVLRYKLMHYDIETIEPPKKTFVKKNFSTFPKHMFKVFTNGFNTPIYDHIVTLRQ